MKINRNYAKLEENKPVYAPNILLDGDVQIINATAEKYAEHGFLPVERTAQPAEEGFYFTPVYTEENSRIVQGWEKHELEIPDEATDDDYINALEELGVNFDE